MEAPGSDLKWFHWVVLLVLFAFILFIGRALVVAYRHANSSEPEMNLNDHLLGNLQHSTLKREDIQAILAEQNKWGCDICNFLNLKSSMECSLCGTANGVLFGSIELNDRQQMARKRKKWMLMVDDQGKQYWSRNENISQTDMATSSQVSEGYLSTLVVRTTEEEEEANQKCENPRLTLTSTDNECTSNELSEFTNYNKILQLSRQNFFEKYSWFLDQLATLAEPYKNGHIQLKIYRRHILNESLNLIGQIDDLDVHKILRVTFIEEDAIDAGGLLREWYSIMAQQMLLPETELFIANDENYYSINPNAKNRYPGVHLKIFRNVGRFLGRALLDGQVLPFGFNLPFFKYMLGNPISFSDLQYVDREVYYSMVYIRDNAVTDLGLSFSICEDCGDGNVNIIELCPNGNEIEVTEENKKEYLRLRWKYLMMDRVASELQSFLAGFYQVIPQELIMVFDYKELELLMCGFSSIDIKDWQENTKVSQDLENSKLLLWFWEIMYDLTETQKAKLLQFSTGSPRVPVQGFKGLTSYDGRICLFSLKLVEYDSKLPYIRVHSCFNRVDLPDFPTKELLEKAIEVILNMENCHFTIE